MILGFDLRDLPGDAITVLLLLLVSFFGWLKNRFEQKGRPSGEPTPADDETAEREVIWRRQVGQPDDRAPWEVDPTVWHPETATPPPLPEPAPEPTPATPSPPPATRAAPTGAKPSSGPQISEREKRLAEAFTRNTGARRRRRDRALEESLRTPASARRAVILAEVLGPPLALRDSAERHP